MRMRAIINVLMRGQTLYLHMCKAWLSFINKTHKCSHEGTEIPLTDVSSEEKRMFSQSNMSPIYRLFTNTNPF